MSINNEWINKMGQRKKVRETMENYSAMDKNVIIYLYCRKMEGSGNHHAK
jgi:hypothetical protein